MYNVAFVCLGNICRSPMAEAVFANTVKKAGLDNQIHCDSFGTGGFHIGSSPDPRTIEVCRANNTPIRHSAQQIKKSDFEKFDLVIGMDHANVRNLLKLSPPPHQHKVRLFGEFKGTSNHNAVVEDPYYGSEKGFERNFSQVTDFSENLVKYIKTTLNI